MKIKTINHVAGGYTFNFDKGVYSNVEVFDWSSLYPSVIISFNISPETIITKEYAEEHKIPYIYIPSDYHEADGIEYEEKYFRKDVEGIMPKLLKNILDMRYEKKYKKFEYKDTNPKLFSKLKAEEIALKIVANSNYGFFGFKNSRLYNPIIANAITQTSRYLTKEMVKVAKECGFEVLAGDTDSVFIINKNNKSIKQLEERFKERIKEIVKEQNAISDEYLNFEHEKTYQKICYIKKKHYATLVIERDEKGNPIGQPEIDIKGLQMKKKDTSPLGKEWQKKLVVDCYLLDKITEEEFIQELKEFKEEFMKGNIDIDYLIMAKTLTKHPNQYGKPMIDSKTGDVKKNKDGSIRMSPIPAHVVLAKKMIDNGEDVNVGDLIKYIVKKSKPRIEAITIEEYEKERTFDKIYYWDNCVSPILNVLFVLNKELVYKNKELWFIKKPRDYTKKLKTMEKKIVN